MAEVASSLGTYRKESVDWPAMGKKTSIYLPDELAEAIRASGKSIPDLIRLGLEAGKRGRADRLADEVERMLRMLQDGYTFIPRERTADQGLPVIPDCRAQAIGSTARAARLRVPSSGGLLPISV